MQALRVVQTPAAVASILDPARFRILQELVSPGSASDLARRLNQPRQRVNYHLRELEKAGLVRLLEERRKGNCTERIMQAVARRYVVSPEVLGEFGSDPAKVGDPASSAYLIAVASQTIREVAILRDRAEAAGGGSGAGDDQPVTLAIRSEVSLDSADSARAFSAELAECVAGLVAKHHRPSAASPAVFKVIVGGYPAAGPS